MNLFETIVVVAALAVAGAVAIVNKTIDPVLAGLLGAAIGYGGKGLVNSAPAINSQVPRSTTFKGAPE